MRSFEVSKTEPPKTEPLKLRAKNSLKDSPHPLILPSLEMKNYNSSSDIDTYEKQGSGFTGTTLNSLKFTK